MELSRQFRRAARLCIIIGLASAFFLVITAKHTDAHKPVTSKYNYYRDILPLLRDHCAVCHVEGGPAPMSLVKYKDAVPWAESIRDVILFPLMKPQDADAKHAAEPANPT